MVISDTAASRPLKVSTEVTRSHRIQLKWALHLALWVLAALEFYPMILAIIMSLKTNTQYYIHPFSLTFPLDFANYSQSFAVIWHYMLNSVAVVSISLAGTLIVSTLAGFVIGRYRFPGRDVLYYMLIALMMVPGVLTMVPMFVLISRFGMVDSWWGLVFPYVAGGEIFSIFLLRQFMMGIPQELFDAAQADGASMWQEFWHIALPAVRPIIGVIAVNHVVGWWNDLIWPSIVISNPKWMTLMPGLYSFTGQNQTNVGPLMAGYVIGSVPLVLLFIFTSRLFVEGMNSGAFKL
ncbi:MAG: carbohydrate ABC transporter permease [Firmicutes bacterium]|nr:carbohydrate ABC transporter permease [Bacillota bacterium]